MKHRASTIFDRRIGVAGVETLLERVGGRLDTEEGERLRHRSAHPDLLVIGVHEVAQRTDRILADGDQGFPGFVFEPAVAHQRHQGRHVDRVGAVAIEPES